VQLLELENRYEQAVTLRSRDVEELCVAKPGHSCKIGEAALGLELTAAVTSADRAAYHVSLSSDDGRVNVALFSNLSARALQSFKPDPYNSGDCPGWSGESREVLGKQPSGTIIEDRSCTADECCQALCCASTTVCDAWAVSTVACFFGLASSWISKPNAKFGLNFRGRALDGALCRAADHYRTKVGMMPSFVHGDKPYKASMTQMVSCTTATCCQEACCDAKATCSAWAFGTDVGQQARWKGCWIGIEYNWVQVSKDMGDWIGATGRVGRTAVSHLAHTTALFDGYYSLTVNEAGVLLVDNVKPCTDPEFPVAWAHYRVGNKLVKHGECSTPSCCQSLCKSLGITMCHTWSFSRSLGCYTGTPTKLIYDPTALGCSSVGPVPVPAPGPVSKDPDSYIIPEVMHLV